MYATLIFKSFRRIRENWKTIFGAVLVAVVVYSSLHGFSDSTVPRALPKFAVVGNADVTQIVQAVGQLQPKLKVDVGAQVTGQVQRLHVQVGQIVKAGTLLVSLDSDSARNAVQQAEAALARQAATVNAARIDLAEARREVERQHRLIAGSATTNQDVEKADTTLAKLEAQIQAEEATLDQRRADLRENQLKLTYTQVSSPIEGEVVAITVQKGQTVNALQSAPTLITLAQLNTMTVHTHVNEADIGLVKVGQAASFSTLISSDLRYEGKVRVIEPIPQRIGDALFYDVLFEVDNAKLQLLIGMTVSVYLEVARAHEVATIPIIALGQRDSVGRFTVQVLDGDGVTRPRQVRIGIRDDSRAQVLEGLELGERILLSPPLVNSATAIR